MIDLKHPLAVLACRLPWDQIESTLTPFFERRNRAGRIIQGDDLFGKVAQFSMTVNTHGLFWQYSNLVVK